MTKIARVLDVSVITTLADQVEGMSNKVGDLLLQKPMTVMACEI